MAASSRTHGGLWLVVATTAALSLLAADPAYWEAFVGVAFVQGALLLALWQRGGLSTRTVLVVAVLCRLVLLWLPGALSNDFHRYVWDGVLQAEGFNPYLHTPSDPELAFLQDEPMYERLNSKRFYTVYPPFSQLVFALGGFYYDSGWLASYYVIKVCFVAVEGAGLFLLARMVEARTLLLYACHPLVLIETAGQPHTEAAMVGFLIATVWLAERGRPRAAAVALVLAGYVKLYPFVLFPLLWRRFGWKAVWPAGLVLLLLALPYADPAVPRNVLASLNLYVNRFEFNAGLYFFLKEMIEFLAGRPHREALGSALRLGFLGVTGAVYVLDARRGWSLRRAFLLILGAYLVLATTVHPWYLLGVLALCALVPGPRWHWQWLGLVSLGTYLRYVDGPYFVFVWLGWTGWFLFLLYTYADPLLQGLQRRRARQKVARVRALLSESEPVRRVLDLGAGEGYVGERLRAELQADVVLADVVAMNRTTLPHVVYDGRTLPFEDRSFDVTVLYFVLHHCADARQVLQQALRVTRGRVVLAESVYTNAWDHALLRFLDRWANRLRSGGLMRGQEEHLHFRTEAAWRRLVEDLGATVVAVWRHDTPVHRQLFLALESPPRVCGNSRASEAVQLS